MRRSRLYFGLIIVLIVLIITYTTIGMLDVVSDEELYQVSVIVSNSGSDRWITFKEGLDQGAEDNNIKLNIVSTSTFTSIEEQNGVIAREIKNGANGIVLASSFSTNVGQTLEKLLSGVALVLVETDITPNNLYTTIEPNNYEIGDTIAQAIQEDNHHELSNVKIGVLSGNQNKLSMQQRLLGFQKAMNQSGAQILWEIQDTGDGMMQILKEKQKNQPVDVLVALDNNEIEITLDFMEMDKSCKFKVYGEGCSEKAVYYLDKGYIQALNVPNEFNMGYQSMVVVADLIKNNIARVENRRIESLMVNKDNLYDDKNQRLLFPIVQ